MAKGYIVARMTVNDADAYMNYAKGARVAMAKYGARILALAGETEPLQGTARERNVILEFDSLEQAKAYYHSPEYQAAREHRVAAGVSEGEIIAMAGFEGPQPADTH